MKPKDMERFNKWLSERGAEVLQPTNPYELARFRAKGGTHVVYINGKGRITAHGFAQEALSAFLNNKHIDMGVVKSKRKPYAKERAVLVERDGWCCFYCGHPMTEETMTLEHLIALADGGTNRLGNMVLAHEDCNRDADKMPLIKKIELRESKHIKFREKVDANV